MRMAAAETFMSDRAQQVEIDRSLCPHAIAEVRPSHLEHSRRTAIRNGSRRSGIDARKPPAHTKLRSAFAPAATNRQRRTASRVKI